MDIKDLPYILTAAYLIIISIIGFILPPVDKSKARKIPKSRYKCKKFFKSKVKI